MKTIKAEKGHSIYKTIQMAKYEAGIIGDDVELIFNEIPMIVSQYSYDIDIATIYNLKHRIRQLECR